jgi:phospholipid/cholesterol/gamma-HCH transport system ATP-binding protein
MTATASETNIYARLEDVGVRYGPKVVMQHLSLDIVEGAITCIIGLSGAGKSTILRLINGLRHPDAGRVLLKGRDISALAERDLIEIREKIGFSFQFAALFDSLSIYENVALPLRERTNLPEAKIRALVTETLESVGLAGATDLIIRLKQRLNGTAVVVSHDLESIYLMADYVAMLFEGAIVAYGTVEEIKVSPNPIVQQFLQGSEVGPIPI